MLRSVLIGCGAIAREHLAALKELENADVIAVCDLSASRAEATAERFGIGRWYTDYEALLRASRPDVVHITTPPSGMPCRNCPIRTPKSGAFEKS